MFCAVIKTDWDVYISSQSPGHTSTSGFLLVHTIWKAAGGSSGHSGPGYLSGRPGMNSKLMASSRSSLSC